MPTVTRPALNLHKVCKRCGIEKLNGALQIIGICRNCRKYEKRLADREIEERLDYAFISYD